MFYLLTELNTQICVFRAQKSSKLFCVSFPPPVYLPARSNRQRSFSAFERCTWHPFIYFSRYNINVSLTTHTLDEFDSCKMKKRTRSSTASNKRPSRSGMQIDYSAFGTQGTKLEKKKQVPVKKKAKKKRPDGSVREPGVRHALAADVGRT